MKHLLFFFLSFLLLGELQAQQAEVILARVILIGDGGELNQRQAAVVKHASENILKGKTKVMYLGDNIYPNGIGLPGSKDEEKTHNILRSQYQPMRAKGAPVYFIPGNHDWDDSGEQGLAKIKRQWEFLEEQKDSLLKMIPANGCPDPVEIKVSADFTIIAFDSQWWLHRYDKKNPKGNCACNGESAILAQMKELVKQNKDKVILLASHHPFQTYGAHGGYSNYPIFGSLIGFFKRKYPSRQDVSHPIYKQMISKISSIFDEAPNVIYVAGHDHGLQFIKGKDIQVVSGAGAKEKDALKGENSLFADAKPGYVTVDLLSNKTLKISFFVETDAGMQKVFTNLINRHANNESGSK